VLPLATVPVATVYTLRSFSISLTTITVPLFQPMGHKALKGCAKPFPELDALSASMIDNAAYYN